MYKLNELMEDYTKEELAEKVIELDKRETELLINGRKAQDKFNKYIDELVEKSRKQHDIILELNTCQMSDKKMSILEFAEKMYPNQLTEMQKEILIKFEYAQNNGMVLHINYPPIVGRKIIADVISKYENEVQNE